MVISLDGRFCFTLNGDGHLLWYDTISLLLCTKWMHTKRICAIKSMFGTQLAILSQDNTSHYSYFEILNLNSFDDIQVVYCKTSTIPSFISNPLFPKSVYWITGKDDGFTLHMTMEMEVNTKLQHYVSQGNYKEALEYASLNDDCNLSHVRRMQLQSLLKAWNEESQNVFSELTVAISVALEEASHTEAMSVVTLCLTTSGSTLEQACDLVQMLLSLYNSTDEELHDDEELMKVMLMKEQSRLITFGLISESFTVDRWRTFRTAQLLKEALMYSRNGAVRALSTLWHRHLERDGRTTCGHILSLLKALPLSLPPSTYTPLIITKWLVRLSDSISRTRFLEWIITRSSHLANVQCLAKDALQLTSLVFISTASLQKNTKENTVVITVQDDIVAKETLEQVLVLHEQLQEWSYVVSIIVLLIV